MFVIKTLQHTKFKMETLEVFDYKSTSKVTFVNQCVHSLNLPDMKMKESSYTLNMRNAD